MEWSCIERQWATHFRAVAALRWGRLSEQQLDGTAGRRIALALALQHVYCVTPTEADRQVTDWLRNQQAIPEIP